MPRKTRKRGFSCHSKKDCDAKLPPITGVPDWYLRGNGYQIYVRSFLDTNGDGYGDLPGVLQKVDYIKELGADFVWFNPVYPSPNYDWGYDVSDFFNINPDFGTLADFDAVVAALHNVGIKVLNDLVVAQTAPNNQWFINSATSVPGYVDFYIWQDGATPGPPPPAGTGTPPNDDQAIFGGSAWTYDPRRNQWYYGLFSPEQPNLNYADPAVIAAMQSVVSFWYSRGVDGFRVDSTESILPTSQIDTVLQALRATQNQFPNRVFVNETFDQAGGSPPFTIGQPFDDINVVSKLYVDPSGFPPYYDLILPIGQKMNTNFDFTIMNAGLIGGGQIEFSQVVTVSNTYNQFYNPNGILTYEGGNHDNSRGWGTFFKYITPVDKDLATIAYRTYLMLTYLSRMVPFTYMGDEIDMPDPAFNLLLPPAENTPLAGYPWTQLVTPDQLSNPYIPRDNIMYQLGYFGARDQFRTPMQWNGNLTEYAGFSTGAINPPWIPVTSINLDQANVEAQQSDPKSTLNMVKLIYAIRKKKKALNGYGDYKAINDLKYPGLFVFERSYEDSRYLVILNMGFFDQINRVFGDQSEHDPRLTSEDVIYEADFTKGKIIVSSYMDRNGKKVGKCINIRRFEGLLIKVCK